MKNTVEMGSCPKSSRWRKRWRGFSVIEVMMVMAVMSSITACAYLVYSGTHEAAKSTKLRSDTMALNTAVRAYLVHGGKIPTTATAADVIAKLKSTGDASTTQHLAGLRNSMVDPRLRGIPADISSKERAVWNSTKQRFEIKTSGIGFREFDLAGDPTVAPKEETRKGTMNLGVKDKWIWDSSETAMARPVMREVLVGDVPQIAPQAPGAITKLAAPDVSRPGALYDFSAFSPYLSVSLIDVNPPGTARLFYSIDGGEWQEYGGTPLRIPGKFTTEVRTYAQAINNESYEDSEPRTESYETIYFTGKAEGVFHTPVGDGGLLTNLVAGLQLPLFTWGRPSGSGSKTNELKFSGSKFERVAPDQEFELGTLSYYNGTTASGTNATAVQFRANLTLSTPDLPESLNYTFKLLSTTNRGKDENADADYVWIPSVSTNFKTTIKGRKFALVLSFGEHGSNGFTTIDTFHAFEGKTLTGKIYGRFTEVK